MSARLEVADVFRHHGEAYRQAHVGHLGRVERRTMSAIELCRTAELGGHVRGMSVLRHDPHRLQFLSQPALPEVPGAGMPGMACCATGRTPAGSLFPCRLHAAGADRGDRLPEQGGGLHHPVQGRGRDAAHDRRRSQASGRRDRPHRGAAQLGPEPALPSAHPLHRAGWRSVARPHALDPLPTRLLPARARAVAPVPPALSGRTASGL